MSRSGYCDELEPLLEWRLISEWDVGMSRCIFARLRTWDDVEYSLRYMDGATHFALLISPFAAGFEPEAKFNPNKIGILVRCEKCGRQKCPRGRSAPFDQRYCEPDVIGNRAWGCAGYREPPVVGDLWPGESEWEFGFACADEGTEILEPHP